MPRCSRYVLLFCRQKDLLGLQSCSHEFKWGVSTLQKKLCFILGYVKRPLFDMPDINIRLLQKIIPQIQRSCTLICLIWCLDSLSMARSISIIPFSSLIVPEIFTKKMYDSQPPSVFIIINQNSTCGEVGVGSSTFPLSLQWLWSKSFTHFSISFCHFFTCLYTWLFFSIETYLHWLGVHCDQQTKVLRDSVKQVSGNKVIMAILVLEWRTEETKSLQW